MRGLSVLSRALRWALVGMTFSMLSNAIFEGSVIPSILIVGLPAWVIAFRKTFNLVIDFASPISAWIVQRFGSFRSLATTEGVEGVLCLAVALVPNGWTYWKWLLLALSCLLLMTGQVIDVASEVFEVDAAGDDDDMLVKYSGYVAVIASVAGTLLGQVAGSALANASIMAMLLTSSALSFACALTRFRTREFMPGFDNDGAGGDDGDGSADESTAADTSHAPQRTPVTRLTRVRLLIASLLLALIPSLWASYALLGIGSRYGSDMLTVVYAFGGVGSIIGSFVYMRLSAKLGMRAVSAIGAIATAISLAAVLVPEFAAVCVGWLINNLGYGLLAHGVIVSRQLLLSGGDLAKFSGRARFAYAIGGAVGTWGGWLGSAHWQILAVVALVLCAGFIPLLKAMPGPVRH